MSHLSERQKRILEFTTKFIAEHGVSPTIREIGENVGISSSSVVQYNLEALESKGLLVRKPDTPRGICLPRSQVKSGFKIRSHPVLRQKNLSERQGKILEFLREYIRENRFPPTIREIGERVGITSTSVVKYNLDVLEREGLIERDREIGRGLRLKEDLVERAADLVRVPFLGRIAAGEPLPGPSDDFVIDLDDTLELTQDVVKDERDIFALEVKGNSMIDALIGDGDIVLMRHQERVENGELAAIWLQDQEETTLKRFYLEGKEVRLQPENPTMRPMFHPAADVRVIGKVVGVIRRFA